ncbi:MAG TPA: VOC family protein [Acidimicrobiia bacterium]
MTIELLHFRSPDADGEAAARRLEGYGGTILPTTRSNPGVELVFLADPDGVRVELMQRG